MKRVYFLIAFIFFTEEIFAQQMRIDTIESGYEIEIIVPVPQFKVISEHDSIPVLDHSMYLYEKNAPELLKINTLLRSFTKEGFKTEILLDSTIIIETSIAPSLGFIYQNEETPPRKKGDIYSGNEFFPEQLIRTFPVVQHRENFYQNFWIHFMQYKPVKKQLLLHKYLKIRFIEKHKNIKAKKKKKREKNENRMLILVNDSMKSTLFPFIRWKKQIGTEVFMHNFVSPPTSSEIKTTIRNYYENQQIDFVLLIGDEQIPTNTSNYGPSDYAYTLISGNDVYGDVMIGRFPADNNPELSAMIAKTMAYEKAIFTGQKPMTMGGIASAEGSSDNGDNGETDIEHIYNIGQNFVANNFDTLLIVENRPSENSVSSLFEKADYVFYTGHGDQTGFRSVKFTNDSIYQLKNADNHSVLIDAACLNGDFRYNDCMAEWLMKIHNDTAFLGTTAIFASTISQLWAPPMLGQDVFANELFSEQNNKKIIGEIAQSMFFELISTYGAGGTETVFTWTFFGDPSLNLWNKLPMELSVTAPEYLDLSSDFSTIEAPEGSLITLVTDTIILAKSISENGIVNLFHGAMPQLDSVFLTVSAPQCKPVVKILKPYTEVGSYYSISQLGFHDNNNNIPENYEWITIKPKLINYGNETGNNIIISISESENVIEFNTDEITIFSIEGNSTQKEFSFNIRTTETLSDKTTAKLHFAIQDETGQTNQKDIEFQFFAPIVQFDTLAVNENWTASQPIVTNDTVIVSAAVRNEGHAPLYNAKLTLDINDVFVDNVENEIVIEELPPMSKDTFHLKIIVNSECYSGHKFSGTLCFENQSLPFSFFYKKNPNLTIGEKEFVSTEFPFYNYYKAEKSQLLYRAESFAYKQLHIDSIGFWVSRTSSNEVDGRLTNFVIKVLETEISEFGIAYENTENANIIFSEETFILPQKKGLFYIDVNDFEYSGTQNLLLEIIWGQNTTCSSYNNSYELYSTSTDYTSSVFGYSDETYPPGYRGNSDYIPDIFFATRSTELFNVKFSLEENETVSAQDTFLLKIGGDVRKIALNMSLQYSLPQGIYSYNLLCADNYQSLYSDTLTLSENNQEELIVYSKLTNIQIPDYKSITLYYYAGSIFVRSIPAEHLNYKIFDLQGRELKNGTLLNESERIPFNQKKGIYLIQLVGEKTTKSIKFFVD